MKKIIRNTIVAGSMAVLAGCATPFPAGGLFTGTMLPVGATANPGNGAKSGVASCQSFLAMVSIGDCSIETAKRNGGITQVTHMDWKANNILGIIGNYELIVYGN
ncbi:MAG TPA: TRL-like protein family [Gammaproteobacteria bacterium]|jgi:hypothetical protein|nr:TRL-like protein family [Gammaproteobacteria bacterium]